jgi:hypothetical protein
MGDAPLAIDVATPLGFRAVCSEDYWRRITTIKHPPMKGRKKDVEETLSNPDEIRRSVGDPGVLLFHRKVLSRWVCAVVKCLQDQGFLITAYPADKVKRGELIWKK